MSKNQSSHRKSMVNKYMKKKHSTYIEKYKFKICGTADGFVNL